MDKNDFDKEYDFEKELGFDPREFLDSDGDESAGLSDFQNISQDDDLDLSQFGLDDYTDDAGAQQESSDDFRDFDLEGINLDDIPGDPDDSAAAGYGEDIPYDRDHGYSDREYDEPETDRELPEQEPSYEEEEPFEEGDEEILRRPRQDDRVQEDQYMDPEYTADGEAADAYDPQGDYPPEEGYSEEDFSEEAYGEETSEDEDRKPRKHKEKKPKKERKKPQMPPFFKNFLVLYFGAAIAEMTGMNQEAEGRRKRSKYRVFKEAYLPPILLLVTVILVLTFVIGSVSNAVQRKHVNDEQNRKESVAESEEEDRLEAEYRQIMAKAELAAQGYDFDQAIEILGSYSGDAPQEMQTKRAEYNQMATKMVEWKDPTGIPNLSFHALVADPARAYADKELGGKYNQNFATTDEFQKILESLYANNYVLVDFDSFVETSESSDGHETFMLKPILLPDGKKPVMITETLVNYYEYMIDGNKDGKPDANGAGFASRLLVDANGDIKAEMVDKDGNTVVGDYDLVPILETFLKTHPDFSYRGARAIVAPSGEQGIFGYRIQSSVISDPKRGQTYYNEQVQGAKEVVQALRDKGYTLACYSYGNRDYGQINANQITEDLQTWNAQITPVYGDTNVMVYAQGGDIGDYTGTKFKAMYDKGYRFFVGKGDKPFADVANTYVRQKRIMVTGSNMFWNGKMFTGMFDTAAILNPMRGDVPKAK